MIKTELIECSTIDKMKDVVNRANQYGSIAVIDARYFGGLAEVLEEITGFGYHISKPMETDTYRLIKLDKSNYSYIVL